MSSREVWHFEKVTIKDSEYARKCGLKGECYFWVSKGLIKIEQLDRKTSFQITVSHIRNWGASSKIFFLELGTRSPTGHGRLEMNTKDPNSLRLLVRDTTSSSKRKDIPVSKTSDDTDVYPSGYGLDNYGVTPDQDTDYDYDETPAVPDSKLKWYKKKTTDSEESKDVIPVGKQLNGRHIQAGERNDVYSMPIKKNK